MRIGMRRKISFKIIYIKKIIAIIVISATITVLFGSFFFRVYRPYISTIVIGRANNIIQKIINETVLDVVQKDNFDSLVNLIKDSENRITGIETNIIRVNVFKSRIVKDITERLNSINNEKFSVPLFAFLNNPFFSERGPVIFFNIRPVGIIKTDLNSSFVSVGVNQSKHQIDLICNCEILIVMPSFRIEHSVSTTVPVSQTVIVGDVPQTYTNVTTSKEKQDDVVLQLAGN